MVGLEQPAKRHRLTQWPSGSQLATGACRDHSAWYERSMGAMQTKRHSSQGYKLLARSLLTSE